MYTLATPPETAAHAYYVSIGEYAFTALAVENAALVVAKVGGAVYGLCHESLPAVSCKQNDALPF